MPYPLMGIQNLVTALPWGAKGFVVAFHTPGLTGGAHLSGVSFLYSPRRSAHPCHDKGKSWLPIAECAI
jgi:hypothetical protein